MTIIRQKKESDPVKQWTIVLSITAACAAVAGVFFYNQVVNNSHEMAQRRGDLRDIEVRNAELKGELYALTDPQRVQEFATKNNLIVEKNPNYVKRQAVSINL